MVRRMMKTVNKAKYTKPNLCVLPAVNCLTASGEVDGAVEQDVTNYWKNDFDTFGT